MLTVAYLLVLAILAVCSWMVGWYVVEPSLRAPEPLATVEEPATFVDEEAEEDDVYRTAAPVVDREPSVRVRTYDPVTKEWTEGDHVYITCHCGKTRYYKSGNGYIGGGSGGIHICAPVGTITAGGSAS